MNENNIESFNISYSVAEDWGTLYEMVRMVNSNPKEGEQTAEQIIQDIEDVRSGKKPLSELSNTFDLQSTVASFLDSDVEIAA